MRTHKTAQANAGLSNELVPKIRKKKKQQQQQAMPLCAEDATSTQQLQRQVDLTNSLGRSMVNRKRKITDSGESVETPEKRRSVESDVVKYLLTLASHDTAKKSSMITQVNLTCPRFLNSQFPILKKHLLTVKTLILLQNIYVVQTYS